MSQQFRHVILYENSKENALNKITFHNLQSYLACWHTKFCALIRHTICESLVNSDMNGVNNVWKYPKKRNKRKGFFITCSHIWLFDISVLIRYTIIDSLVEIQQFRHESSSNFYENTLKNIIKSRVFHNSITCSHIWHVDTTIVYMGLL